jgi:predicted ATPase
MKIESIYLSNFRMFQNVTLSKLPNCCFFVGANGTGKSSLFDVFGFLRDALAQNIKQALAKRGGFKEVVSRGTEGPIELALQFRDLKATSSQISYSLIIDLADLKPIVKREVLKYQPKQNYEDAKPVLLDFSQGKGKILINHNYQELKLSSPTNLALKGIGQFQQFEVASELCDFIENWHLSDLQIDEARKINQANGYNEHLSRSGDNLALFAQFVYNHYPERYQTLLHHMAYRVPGFSSVEPVATVDGRISVKFQDNAFKDAFASWQVSEGTMSLFAYMLLLYDPNPHSLLCVEEPEPKLYPDILRVLAEEFSLYAQMGEGQVFVSSHSPDFINGAELTEIFWLTKKEGYTQVRTTAESPLMQRLVDVGDLPGALWKQGFFEGAHP